MEGGLDSVRRHGRGGTRDRRRQQERTTMVAVGTRSTAQVHSAHGTSEFQTTIHRNVARLGARLMDDGSSGGLRPGVQHVSAQGQARGVGGRRPQSPRPPTAPSLSTMLANCQPGGAHWHAHSSDPGPPHADLHLRPSLHPPRANPQAPPPHQTYLIAQVEPPVPAPSTRAFVVQRPVVDQVLCGRGLGRIPHVMDGRHVDEGSGITRHGANEQSTR